MLTLVSFVSIFSFIWGNMDKWNKCFIETIPSYERAIKLSSGFIYINIMQHSMIIINWLFVCSIG